MIATMLVVLLSVSDALNYGQPSAALWEDQLFVAITRWQRTGPALVYRGKFTPTSSRVRGPLEHDNPSRGLRDSTQAKLDLRDDRLLLRSAFDRYCIYPLDQVWRLEHSAFGVGRFGGLGPYSEFTFGYSATYETLLWPDHRELDVPLSETDRDDGDRPSARTYWAHARYDVQIAGEKSVWLFHAYKDKLFVSVEPDYLNDWYWDGEAMKPKKDRPKPRSGNCGGGNCRRISRRSSRRTRPNSAVTSSPPAARFTW
ncbi:MAG: hypothetical protein J0I06_21390 [Planctomycetes bacterium]|nr:hypothetical protein [Planctomycetota bacterium]